MARKTKAQGKRRSTRSRDAREGRRPRKQVCHFCSEKIDYVDYKDVALLRRYMSDRAKIRARRVTGTCAQHQRSVARAIKNARELALMPYTARQGD